MSKFKVAAESMKKEFKAAAESMKMTQKRRKQ